MKITKQIFDIKPLDYFTVRSEFYIAIKHFPEGFLLAYNLRAEKTEKIYNGMGRICIYGDSFAYAKNSKEEGIIKHNNLIAYFNKIQARYDIIKNS